MVAPDFSTWHAVLRAQPGDNVAIINRAHPYCGFFCDFVRFENERVYVSVPFGSGPELTDADISEVRFDDPRL